jgi:hypothetical protein
VSVSRTLAVQSVLYLNDPSSIRLAAESLANALTRHRAGIAGWTYLLGDCGPTPCLPDETVAEIADLVAAAGGSLSYLPFGENLGHGGGHNRLATQTDAELLLFLNPDAIVAPPTIERLVDAFVEGVGAVDARQIPLEHPQDYDRATGAASWVSGSCLLTSRAVFEAVGGFDDETFFLYCDDVDYSWRVRLQGLEVRHVATASIFHDKRLTLRGGLVAGDAEQYYSREASLLLPYKFSRPDVVRRVERGLKREARTVDAARRALEEFARRRAAGLLPPRLDPRRTVALFVGRNYAPHRF